MRASGRHWCWMGTGTGTESPRRCTWVHGDTGGWAAGEALAIRWFVEWLQIRLEHVSSTIASAAYQKNSLDADSSDRTYTILSNQPT